MLSGGSKWNRALPGRRQRRPIICGEAHRFEDFGNFNLWFPNSSTEPAEAGGCRLSLPGGSKCVQAQPAGASPSRGGQCPPVNPQEILRIRRIRELQFMVPEFVASTGGSKRANFGGDLGEREAKRSLPQRGCGGNADR